MIVNLREGLLGALAPVSGSVSWPEVDPCVCRLVLSLSLANLASLLMETLAGAALLLAPGQ